METSPEAIRGHDGLQGALQAGVFATWDLYQRAEPAAPGEEKVFRVIRQCHPRFQPYLRSRRFSDFEDLAKEATAIQASLMATESYQPPPPKEACLEASCAFTYRTPPGMNQRRPRAKRTTQRGRKAALFMGAGPDNRQSQEKNHKRAAIIHGKGGCSAYSPQRCSATVGDGRSADSPQRCGATMRDGCSADSPQR
ncbi:uncharacterized protein LOC144160127 [Haemaphysalis longicornis]